MQIPHLLGRAEKQVRPVCLLNIATFVPAQNPGLWLERWLSWPSAYLVNVKTLHSLSRTYVKNLGVMKRTYDPSSGKAEMGGFLGLGGLVRNLVSRATEEHG